MSSAACKRGGSILFLLTEGHDFPTDQPYGRIHQRAHPYAAANKYGETHGTGSRLERGSRQAQVRSSEELRVPHSRSALDAG